MSGDCDEMRLHTLRSNFENVTIVRSHAERCSAMEPLMFVNIVQFRQVTDKTLLICSMSACQPDRFQCEI